MTQRQRVNPLDHSRRRRDPQLRRLGSPPRVLKGFLFIIDQFVLPTFAIENDQFFSGVKSLHKVWYASYVQVPSRIPQPSLSGGEKTKPSSSGDFLEMFAYGAQCQNAVAMAKSDHLLVIPTVVGVSPIAVGRNRRS